MADDRNAAAALIEELERLLERGGDEGKLRRAMSFGGGSHPDACGRPSQEAFAGCPGATPSSPRW